MLRSCHWLVFVFAGAICGISAFAAGAQDGVWIAKTPMPVPRSHVTAAGIEGQLYVAGGINTPASGFSPLDLLELYDPVMDTWTTRAPMSDARDAAGSAVIGNKLYVAGGQSVSGDTATLEVYDPTTDSWTTKASMPTPRRWPAVEAIDGLLYVVGGIMDIPGPFTVFTTLEVYDPTSDTWTARAPLPTPLHSMASGVIDGKLYLAGGFNVSDEAVATLLVYDPATNTWTEKSPMPTARGFPAGAVLDDQLYVVTGIAGFNSLPLQAVEAYDPATDTWRTDAPIPTGRDRLGEVGVIDDRIYVAGGWNPCFGCDIATLEVFEPASLVTEVSIDIRPGSSVNSINPINPKSNGVIPVAILSTNSFDATTVDPLTVRFGSKGAQEAHHMGHIEDVNHDQQPDLVLHFRTRATGIKCGDMSASLMGATLDGDLIEGTDAIRTVGCKP
jgi:N-acetylneuraminic acid mutarotase